MTICPSHFPSANCWRASALCCDGAIFRLSPCSRFADLKLDRVQHLVERAGTRIDLTAKEFSLLEYLMRNAGRSVTRSKILEHVWNLTFDTTTNLVDVYINYVRRKIDDGHAQKLIHTVRGVGYELRAAAAEISVSEVRA
jgi:two-component system, OmpR family, copper resistance phosphate regulon response regulator CusR